MDHALTRDTRPIAAIAALGIGILAASCGEVLPPNADTIAKNPAHFNGQTVTVSGKVKERIDMPLYRCYVVDDGTGLIGVVTKKPLPFMGATVRTEGRVDASFKLGKRPLPVIIEPDPPPTPKAHVAPLDRMPG